MFPSWSEYLYHSTYSNIYAVQFSLSLDVFLSLVVHALVELKDLFPLLDQEGSENTACNENARRDSISNPRKKNNNPLHGRVKY